MKYLYSVFTYRAMIKTFALKYCFILTVALLSCCLIRCSTPTSSDNGNSIIPNDSISPQVDIPWPSLADTPWPMNHGDPQSTGRSKYTGPSLGVLERKIPLYGIEGSLAIGENNIIYIGSAYPPGKFHAFDIQGNQLWEQFDRNYVINSTPILTTDGGILIELAGKIVCLNIDGNIRWEYNNNSGIGNLAFNIGLDGTIYFIDGTRTLKSLSSSGEFLWELKDNRFRYDALGAPTFSPDGRYLYIQGGPVSFSAINVETRNVEWVFGDLELRSSPVVDSQGNIYVIPEKVFRDTTFTLYSISPIGEINWEFEFITDYTMNNTEPTIDYDGNIYFGADTLYSVNYLGKLRWKRGLDSRIIVSPILSDKEGNLYLGLGKGDASGNYLMSFSKEGELRWDLEIIGERAIGASGGITNDGRLVIPTFRAWNILIIK